MQPTDTLAQEADALWLAVLQLCERSEAQAEAFRLGLPALYAACPAVGEALQEQEDAFARVRKQAVALGNGGRPPLAAMAQLIQAASRRDGELITWAWAVRHVSIMSAALRQKEGPNAVETAAAGGLSAVSGTRKGDT